MRHESLRLANSGRCTPLEDSSETLGRFALKLRRHVRVHVSCGRQLAVTQDFLDNLHRDARRQQVARAGVPEVVEPDPRQACGSEMAMEPMSHRRGVEGRPRASHGW
jgi:hypothetical protein